MKIDGKLTCDVAIVGSGIAALAAALKLADDKKVIILTKEKAPATNSAMAQGGIAAVTDQSDSFASHIEDTLVAGAGLCHYEAVRNFIEQAPERIKDLINWGVQFDADSTREGGHSFRRVLHHEDQTGAEMHSKLFHAVLAHPNIEVLENHFAIDLLVNKKIDPTLMGPTSIVGLYVLDKVADTVKVIEAKSTILATGGAGKVYLYTSNWSGATGDGIAMAYRAGARISNLEFMQFHPTCLFHKDARNFLISEAVRGEGGELINSQGEAFMKKYHRLGSLAPRDIVARGIDAEMKRTAEPCVYLDITQQPKAFLQSHFPNIYTRCLEYGIDMSKQPIPVVPAAHYLCGGVVTDVAGQTDLVGLYAIGETACTGLHGANRLASNSLLECLAMAHNCAVHLKTNWQAITEQTVLSVQPLPWEQPEKTDSDEMVVISHMWEEIRRLMWNYVGIVRSTKRLERAQKRLVNIKSEVKEYYSNMKVHSDILELRNIVIVAKLTVECALRRHESRGIHYSLDYPTSPLDMSRIKEMQGSDTII
ncbi:MAG: L-aspartate oxidase [Bdellovibrionaceae bacterium]|nr:L-aspartate oxidase [Bdellovibrio sp.]